MSRIQSIPPEKASVELKEIYTAIENQMGKVPNIFLNMGNSATVLKGYLNLNEAATHTSLNPKLREQIALTVSQTNQCNYCLSAHTLLGKLAGLPDQDVLLARHGESTDPKSKAILYFVKKVVENRARVNDQDVVTLKAAGISDTELVEIILVIMQNMFTNYFNHITDPKIDFPLAPELK